MTAYRTLGTVMLVAVGARGGDTTATTKVATRTVTQLAMESYPQWSVANPTKP